MPNAQLPTEQVQDEAEKLFLEQAKVYYRDLRQAAQRASSGGCVQECDWFEVEAAGCSLE